MEAPSILQLTNVTKRYNSQANPAVDEVSLSLKQGELLGLLGPSGCGKTTLLRIVAGFEKISQGVVELSGSVVCDRKCNLPPEKRDMGMVFQDYALFPHLNVAENIAFGLKGKKNQPNGNRLSAKEINYRIGEVLTLVGLAGLERRYPHELSGGQQQRVALARALAPQPDLILLDEPLSNLDVQVRHRLREEIRRILKTAGTSAIFVTHDREEALAISDKIAVMRQGRLEQIGTPEEIYIRPESRFVAEFVTQANFITAKRRGESWQTEIGEVDLGLIQHDDSNSEPKFAETAEVMLRQEDIILVPDSNASVVVKERQFLGREYRYCLETASGKRLHARTNLSNVVDVGTSVNLSMMQAQPIIFPC